MSRTIGMHRRRCKFCARTQVNKCGGSCNLYGSRCCRRLRGRGRRLGKSKAEVSRFFFTGSKISETPKPSNPSLQAHSPHPQSSGSP